MKKRPVEVSDHAIVRYLERVGGFNIAALRKGIAKRVQDDAPEGTAAIVIDGFRFIIREDEKARVVTTVMRKDWDSPAHPGGGWS